MKYILILFFFVPLIISAQVTKTTTLKLNLYTAHVDTVRAGSKTDSSESNLGFNNNMLRIDYFYNQFLDRFKDSVRAWKYLRAANGLVINSSSANVTVWSGAGGSGGPRLDIWPSSTFGLTLNPYGYSAGQTSAIGFMDNTNARYIGFKAPDQILSNCIFTLPFGDSTAGYLLGTNGSKRLGWYDPASLSVNARWSALLDPTARLSLNLSYTSNFLFSGLGNDSVYMKYQGAPFETANILFGIETGGSGSLQVPIRITARGTSNGVDMTYLGTLEPIGTGHINADRFNGNADVAVADGGTSLSTLTANNLLVGAGSSAVTFIAPSTAGNVLMSNGTTFASTPATKVFGYLFPRSTTAVDSETVPIMEVPGDQTWTLDSIRVIQQGGTTVTMNARRLRSGSSVDLLSSNYTVTTSMSKATGIQNNSLIANDQIFVSIRSIASGTITGMTVLFFYRRAS